MVKAIEIPEVFVLKRKKKAKICFPIKRRKDFFSEREFYIWYHPDASNED